MNNMKWITLQANWIGYYTDVVSDELCDKIMYHSDNVKQLQKLENLLQKRWLNL